MQSKPEYIDDHASIHKKQSIHAPFDYHPASSPPPLSSCTTTLAQRRKQRASRCLKCCIFLIFLGVAAVSVVLPQVLIGRDSPNPQQGHALDLTIVPDARLSQSFYGIDYCVQDDSSLQQVVDDVKVLSQMTTRIRVQIAPNEDDDDPDKTSLVLEAISLINTTQQPMGVMLALSDPTSNTQQYEALWKVLNEHGTENVIGISVSSSSSSDVSDEQMSTLIQQVQEQMSSHGYPSLPVTPSTTSIQQLVVQQQRIANNSHPFFSGIRAEEATDWMWQHYNHSHMQPRPVQQIGWPTGPEDQPLQDAIPSIDNQQMLLDTFVCQANARGVPYYWFEFKDHPPSSSRQKVATFWGLMDEGRAPKHRHMPTCHVEPWQKTNTTTSTATTTTP
ncbi:predicted protein [Lichtheimia corymbifera JMRC:FSU:9682]|uniref:glucan endo-1,3-beta-D-glucosidase n=1 Tax=Lichtheimia corymbifera JMRC:FSU:9682 TaxID=1263082 RepID=A0A068SAZ6_9FUNG|nr:predicted protein [Lichtheimia corymbifera JMRC:FSU:9682]